MGSEMCIRDRLNYAEQSSCNSFIVLTEPGILHQMQQRVPEKTLLDVPGIDRCSCNACPYMRLNTLEKLKACLENLTPAIEMGESMRLKAMKPMQRPGQRVSSRPLCC